MADFIPNGLIASARRKSKNLEAGTLAWKLPLVLAVALPYVLYSLVQYQSDPDTLGVMVLKPRANLDELGSITRFGTLLIYWLVGTAIVAFSTVIVVTVLLLMDLANFG